MKQMHVFGRIILWFAVRRWASLARGASRQGILGAALVAILFCHLTADGQITATPIFSGTNAIAAMAYGDFDPNHPGNELACFLANGSIVELALGPTGWTAHTIFVFHGETPIPWQNPTMRVSLKVGNVLPGFSGNQLILNYFSRIIVVYYEPFRGWTSQIIVDRSDQVGTSWDMDVGHCDPSRPGDQPFAIFETVYDFSEGTVYEPNNWTWDNFTWEPNRVYYAEVGMGVAIGHSNPAFPQNDIVVVTEMGPAYEIVPPPTGGPGPWPMRTIWDDPVNAGWVVRIGNVNPQTPGTNQLVYGTRYTDRIMMSQYNGTNAQNVQILYTGINTNGSANNMWDVAIGQLYPATTASPDKQIFGVDDSGSVYVVQQATNQWQGSILWQDTAPLYAVLAAPILSTMGDQVVVGGASGTVTLLSTPP